MHCATAQCTCHLPGHNEQIELAIYLYSVALVVHSAVLVVGSRTQVRIAYLRLQHVIAHTICTKEIGGNIHYHLESSVRLNETVNFMSIYLPRIL